MNQHKKIFLNQIIIGIDILLTVISFIAAYYIRNSMSHIQKPLQDIREYIWILWVIVPTWFMSFRYYGFYRDKKTQALGKTAVSLFKAVLFSSLIASTAIFITKADLFSRLYFGIFVILNYIIILTEKVMLKYIILTYYESNPDYHRVIIVGVPEQARKFVQEVKNNEDTYLNILGYVQVDDNKFKLKREKVLGRIDKLIDIIIENAVDEVIFALPKDYIGDVEDYILKCEELGVTVRMVLDIYDLKFSKTHLSYVGQLPTLTFHSISFNAVQLFLKRLLDIVGAIVGLFITGVVSIFLVPIIKLDSPGPAFFAQNRIGMNGRVFKCYKFRSMYMDAEARKAELMQLNEIKGAFFKITDDPRITRVGKIIRKLSIDELPQFWNVLKGEMSLVGTRPPTEDEVKQYKNYHRRRLSIKPGITGLWQVSGRSEIKDFEEIVKMDVQYIDNWTIFLDIKIILKTVFVVLSSKGAA